jgi:hypothetical protein
MYGITDLGRFDAPALACKGSMFVPGDRGEPGRIDGRGSNRAQTVTLLDSGSFGRRTVRTGGNSHDH